MVPVSAIPTAASVITASTASSWALDSGGSSRTTTISGAAASHGSDAASGTTSVLAPQPRRMPATASASPAASVRWTVAR